MHGKTSTVSFEGDEIVERAAGGQREVWGTVTERQPGQRIAFT